MIGASQNGTYARETTTAPWRGAMSIPRELSLRQTSEGLALTQEPIAKLSSLRDKEIISPVKISGTALELVIDLELGSAKEAGIKEFKNGGGEKIIWYNPPNRGRFLCRTRSRKKKLKQGLPGD